MNKYLIPTTVVLLLRGITGSGPVIACIGRAQLIRLSKTATGEELRRLDFAAHSELREKVAVINTNEELDHLFTQYGE